MSINRKLQCWNIRTYIIKRPSRLRHFWNIKWNCSKNNRINTKLRSNARMNPQKLLKRTVKLILIKCKISEKWALTIRNEKSAGIINLTNKRSFRITDSSQISTVSFTLRWNIIENRWVLNLYITIFIIDIIRTVRNCWNTFGSSSISSYMFDLWVVGPSRLNTLSYSRISSWRNFVGINRRLCKRWIDSRRKCWSKILENSFIVIL